MSTNFAMSREATTQNSATIIDFKTRKRIEPTPEPAPAEPTTLADSLVQLFASIVFAAIVIDEARKKESANG